MSRKLTTSQNKWLGQKRTTSEGGARGSTLSPRTWRARKKPPPQEPSEWKDVDYEDVFEEPPKPLQTSRSATTTRHNSTTSSMSKEEEELRQVRHNRFHSKDKWMGRKRTTSEGGAKGRTLPPGIGPKLRYSRITSKLSPKKRPPQEPFQWKVIDYEDDFEEPPRPQQPPRPRQVRVERVVKDVVKPMMRSVFVNVKPQTAIAQIQTMPVEQDKPAVSAELKEEEEKRAREMRNIVRSLQPLTGSVQQQADTLEETRKSIRKLTTAHKDLMQKVASGGSDSSEGQVELLMSMREVTDRLEMLTSAQITRTEDEEQLNDRIMEVKDAIETRTVPVESFVQFTDDTERHLGEVTKELKDLRRKHEKLSRAMEESTEQQKKLLRQEQSIQNVVTLVKDIHEYNMGKKAEDEKEKEIKKKVVVPNDSRGKMFLHSNSLPMDDPNMVKQMANLLACIEADADDDLQDNLDIFREDAQKSWGSLDKVKKAISGLFKMALFTKSNKSSIILADAMGGGSSPDEPQTARTEQAAQKNMAEFVKGAINFQNDDMGKRLLERMDNDKRKEVVNTVVKGKYGVEDSYLLFVSARSFDVDMFKFLITCGADLQVKEGAKKQTVLHLLADLSVDEKKEEGVITMMDIINKEAGTWWEQRNSKEGCQGPASEVSRLAAVRYLYDLEDSTGLNPLQFAAKKATPNFIKKVITNPPYHTLTDPVSFDCDATRKVYFMDDLDVRFTGRVASVLESIVDRENNALEICEMEPFCQILSDKWDRYKVFYWMWFIMYLIYISTYSACAIGRHLHTKTLAESYSTTGDMFRGVAEIACIVSLPFFFYGDFCDFNRITFSWKWFIIDEIRIGNFCFVVFVLLTMIFRVMLNDLEDIFLCSSLILGWMLSTRFLIATPLMGVFPGVIFKVFKEDILKRFIWIFLIILIGMTTATFCAYQRGLIPEIPSSSFWFSLFSITKLTFGMLDVDYVTSGRYPIMGVALFLLYLWLGPILLVNMLIAMVNDTYSQTRHEKEREWMHTKARFALIMERRLPRSVWIPYNNDRDEEAPTPMFKMMYRFNLYTQTRLRYGHKLRPRTSLKEAEEREHFVILK